jgi:hypothetical protein
VCDVGPILNELREGFGKLTSSDANALSADRFKELMGELTNAYLAARSGKAAVLDFELEAREILGDSFPYTAGGLGPPRQ